MSDVRVLGVDIGAVHQIPAHPAAMQRRRLRVTGQVQGVGFRPFVFRLAQEQGLTGCVRNDARGVSIEIQGPPAAMDRFADSLRRQPPPLAVIDDVRSDDIAPLIDEHEFHIDASSPAGQRPTADVTVDTAVCAGCLREISDPADRRCGHALITCTDCGPRFSIVRAIPYDRPNTTMAGFAMCPRCRAEYDNPADRRFHAQPIACHDCGPRLRISDAGGRVMDADPLAHAALLVEQGKVVAVKGLGGYHLCVRADDAAAVARLRKLKKRDTKPFALMVRDIGVARRLVRLSDRAVERMCSPACPIILAPKRRLAVVSDAVAPGTHRLGVMLPGTPLQHLLFAVLPADVDVLVMTSGNHSDEPLVIGDDEAVERLGRAGLCDAILGHDRPIARPVDDSVLLDEPAGAPLPVRRARGLAPGAIRVAADGRPGLCVGGELKNTVAVVRGGRAILSQHLGDLSHALAFDHFRAAIEDLCALFEVRPAWIAHDLHPLYTSTRYAGELAARWNVPLVGVQHHHAHAAAVLAEHDHAGPVLAIVADGTGYGSDGTIWGGEVLLADRRKFVRLAHLQPLNLPGGDAAARDTRRCALGLLHAGLGEGFADHPFVRRLLGDDHERAMLTGMIERGLQCAVSSGAGRYFDAVAAILGLAAHNLHEAQAAMALEAAALDEPVDEVQPLLFDMHPAGPASPGATASCPPGPLVPGPVVLHPAPLVRALLAGVAQGRSASALAALFHDQLAAAFASAAITAAGCANCRDVVLSGGVMCNQRFTARLTRLLEAHGLRVLRHGLVPANDGGLSLGQAAIALARMSAHSQNKGDAPCV